jgi:hypothetical protein
MHGLLDVSRIGMLSPLHDYWEKLGKRKLKVNKATAQSQRVRPRMQHYMQNWRKA